MGYRVIAPGEQDWETRPHAADDLIVTPTGGRPRTITPSCSPQP
jgi:hypothetical protein